MQEWKKISCHTPPCQIAKHSVVIKFKMAEKGIIFIRIGELNFALFPESEKAGKSQHEAEAGDRKSWVWEI